MPRRVRFNPNEFLCIINDSTREKLLEKVWGLESERENRTLDVHIRTLRSKLRDEGERIQTVRGVGYKYIGEGQ